MKRFRRKKDMGSRGMPGHFPLKVFSNYFPILVPKGPSQIAPGFSLGLRAGAELSVAESDIGM